MNSLSMTDMILIFFGLGNTIWIAILYIVSMNTTEETEIFKEGGNSK